MRGVRSAIINQSFLSHGTCFLLLAVLTALRNVIGTAAMFIGIGIVLVATLILANTWTKK